MGTVTSGDEGLPGRVVVVGLGLMGGSVARRLAAIPDGPRVVGVEQDPIRGARAREEGIVEACGMAGDGTAAGADLVVLACPLGAARTFFAEEGRGLPPATLVTDLVSLNAPVLKAARAAGLSGRTVTAHPMCGSDESGLDAARDDLFEGARIWLSADDGAGPRTRERVAAFWAALGGRPEWIEAAEHDRVMAWVSHLPQLVSSALAGALDAAGFRPEDLGPGGRDMVRLARSDPDMWEELLEHSAPVTGTGLTSVSRGLGAVADLLARRDLGRITEFMHLARGWAREEAALADEREGPVLADEREEA